MKKKFFTAFLAGVLAISTVISSFAATTPTITYGEIDGFNTVAAYDRTAYTGDFEVVFNFNNKGTPGDDGSVHWCNYIVELTDNTNYATIRADGFGWGTIYDDGATWTGTCTTEDAWDAWALQMADADVVLTVVRSGQTITITNDIITSEGESYSFVCTIDGSSTTYGSFEDTLYLSLGGENVTISAAAGYTVANEDTTVSSDSTVATTTATTSTGDESMTVVMIALALVAVGATVVAKRKKVTE